MNGNFVVNQGWQFVWLDPDQLGKFSIREFIKGPFVKPKIVYPVLTCCQTDSNGIWEQPPNCRVQHSPNGSPGLNLDNSLAKNYDSMHKKGQSFGQGIPDPWTTSPCVVTSKNHRHFSLENIKSDLGKHISQLLQSRSQQNHYKEGPCLCCQKKYLFECPDEANACTLRDRNYLNCSCYDCHGKEPRPAIDSGNCVCLYRNRLVENTSGEVEKKNLESDYHFQKGVKSTSEEESATENLICTCSRNRLPTTDATFVNENVREGKAEQKFWCTEESRGNVERENGKEKVSFHVYLKNSGGKISEYNNNEEDKKKLRSNVFVSKEVQTESSEAFFLKDKESTKQSENDKAQWRRSNYVDTKPKDNLKSKEIPSSCTQYHRPPNTEVVCPCSYSNYLMSQKIPDPQYVNASSTRTKQKRWQKENQEELEDGSSSNFSHIKKDQDEPIKIKCKCMESRPHYACEKVFCCQLSNMPYDQLKLIAENKLRNYMDRRKLPIDTLNNKFLQHSKSFHVPSRFRDIFESCDEYDERYRQFCCYKPKQRFAPSSGEENKFLSSKNQRSRFDPNVFTTRSELNKEVPNRVKFLKEIAESEESYGVSRSGESLTKETRKRKRLLGGRKRRRKLVGRRPLVLVKPPSSFKKTHKNIQPDDTEVSEIDQNKLYLHSKNVAFGFAGNNRKRSDVLNYHNINNLRHMNSVGNFHCKPYSGTVPGTLARIREEVSGQTLESYKRLPSVDGVLERISNRRTAYPCKMIDGLKFKKRQA